MSDDLIRKAAEAVYALTDGDVSYAEIMIALRKELAPLLAEARAARALTQMLCKKLRPTDEYLATLTPNTQEYIADLERQLAEARRWCTCGSVRYVSEAAKAKEPTPCPPPAASQENN